MPELRWILIGFAIVLLAGIYLWGRRGSVRATDQEVGQRSRPEPTMFVDSDGEGHAPAFESSEIDGGPYQQRNINSTEDVDLGVTVERKSNPPPRPKHLSSEGDSPAQRASSNDTWRGRVEPTLADAGVTAELPVEEAGEATTSDEDAPTLSSSETPAPRRSERRKILSLRLAASPHRMEGARLLEVFVAENLQHGKYGIYHRLHDDGVSIFSVASMVEPGTFEPEKMAQTQYSGITMFAQLPGPVPGMHALNELVACARRLQQSLGGTLQDDRGVPLTVHRIERMRQEVREFERPSQATHRGSAPSLTRY
jgi:FtsZ-interacting cell division protein ZipA